jgi:hypothetical protein
MGFKGRVEVWVAQRHRRRRLFELAVHLEEGEMAVATVTVKSKRYDLKSCPDGYVVVKRMTHGQKLFRQDLSSKIKIDTSRKAKGSNAEIDMMRTTITHWEFQNLIDEHNLTDATERPLNFRFIPDINMLDGMVAEEISTYIDEMNNFEPDADDTDTPLATSSDVSD